MRQHSTLVERYLQVCDLLYAIVYLVSRRYRADFPSQSSSLAGEVARPRGGCRVLRMAAQPDRLFQLVKSEEAEAGFVDEFGSEDDPLPASESGATSNRS